MIVGLLLEIGVLFVSLLPLDERGLVSLVREGQVVGLELQNLCLLYKIDEEVSFDPRGLEGCAVLTEEASDCLKFALAKKLVGSPFHEQRDELLLLGFDLITVGDHIVLIF